MYSLLLVSQIPFRCPLPAPSSSASFLSTVIPFQASDANNRNSLTGPLNYYLGRKGTIMFCSVFCFASCLGQAFCRTWPQLLACRLLLGFGVGPKSATIPIYAAESVPSKEIRGALVMSWQLWTAFGIMVGYTVTYIFKDSVRQPVFNIVSC